MNKSTLFTKAHALTKKIIKATDNYRVTFGACIKFIKKTLELITDGGNAVVIERISGRDADGYYGVTIEGNGKKNTFKIAKLKLTGVNTAYVLKNDKYEEVRINFSEGNVKKINNFLMRRELLTFTDEDVFNEFLINSENTGKFWTIDDVTYIYQYETK